MARSAEQKRSSFRTAGVNNIVISCVVAVLSYLSLMQVAHRFGGSIGSDAYFFLFSLTAISSSLITSLFAVVLLPIFVDLKFNESLAKAEEFAGAILALSVFFTVPIALASYIWHELFFSLFSKYSQTQLEHTRFVLKYFAPVFAATVLAEYFRVLALAMGRYTLAALGALFQPVTLTAFLYLFSDKLGEESLSLSLLSSKLCLLVFMLIVVLHIERLKISFLKIPRNALKRFMRVSAPYWTANLITNLATFYFDYVATGLGAGVLSSISYAQKIYTMPIMVIINPILEIARTRFAEARATNNLQTFATQHNKLIQFVLYFTIPVSVIFYFFSREIISSMFQRGAFGENNVTVAASCLSIYAISIPLSSLFMLNGRAVESFQKLTWPATLGTVGNLISILVTYIFVKRMGYLGIPLAKVSLDLFYFLPFGFIALRLFCNTLSFDNIGRVTFTSLAASLLPVLIYYYSGLAIHFEHRFPSLMLLTALLTCILSCYCFLISFLDKRLLAVILIEVRSRFRLG